MANKPDRIITTHVPQDSALLAELGKVVICHGHFDHILKMTIKSITGVTTWQATDAYVFTSTQYLRRLITKLARKRLGEGAPLIKLLALLERSRLASDKRNKYIHSLWAKERDRDPQIRDSITGWEDLPTTEILKNLAEEITEVTDELNEARLRGWLRDALARRPITVQAAGLPAAGGK